MLLCDLMTGFVLLVTGFKFDLRFDAGSARVDVHSESLFTHVAVADLIQNTYPLGLERALRCVPLRWLARLASVGGGSLWKGVR